jgi:hypothetical protein
MYPEFTAQCPEPFEVRDKINDHHVIPNPNPAQGGFNIWWEKTAAQNMAMVTEASDLIRNHRLVSSNVRKSTAFALSTKET